MATLGITAALVNAAAFVPYIASILKRRTKPQRSSWWIWALLMAVALVAQISIGATWSVLFTGVFLIANIIVAILSLTYGYGRFAKQDALVLILALVGLLLWALTNNAIIALTITIIVDFMAYWLTIVKSWRAPYTENLLSWTLMTIAAVLSAISVGSLAPAKLAFPVYVAAVSSFGVYVLTSRRKWRSSRIKAGLRNRKQRIN